MEGPVHDILVYVAVLSVVMDLESNPLDFQLFSQLVPHGRSTGDIQCLKLFEQSFQGGDV